MDHETAIDCTGLCCHLPVMRITERLKTVPAGRRVRIVRVGSGGRNDVEAWIRMTGQDVAERREMNDEFEFVITRKGERK